MEEPPTGAIDTTSTDLDLGLGDDGLGWIVGMRFGALAVPQGAKITAASIQFTTDNSPASTTPVSLTIRGEAADSAALFDDAYSRPSFRPGTDDAAQRGRRPRGRRSDSAARINSRRIFPPSCRRS